MGFIFTIIGLMISLDLVWWIVLARLSNHAGRVLVSIFMIAMVFGLAAIIVARLSRSGWDRFLPKFAVSAIFIWHFLGLGLFTLIGIVCLPILVAGKIVSHKTPAKIGRTESIGWSR
ncbi:MAG TPA: hypothetical protein VI282_11705, partial [Verrucomicrobiae bacterium]